MEVIVNGVIYLVGLVVVVMAVPSFVGAALAVAITFTTSAFGAALGIPLPIIILLAFLHH